MKRPPAALGAYAAKRNFAATPEPAPAPVEGPTNAHAGRFVIQKHAATRLHYDFRLEIEGVLKSWAVTREPSLDPADKRLAVRTEDHPLAYAGFEGTIPKGHYGAGTVVLWDEGRFRVEGDTAARALEDGKLHLHLQGRRLNGEWALVRIRPRPRETRENWLLIAVRPDKAGNTAAEPPAFQPFQLCGQAEQAPDGLGWVHEIKHDGYRAQAAIGGGKARIHLRSGVDATDRLPGLESAFARLAEAPHLVDGELIVQDAEGRSSFGMLQKALADGDDRAILFMAFDLLVAEGRPLTDQPLLARKAALQSLLGGTGAPILYADHAVEAGPALFEAACARGLEGLIAKRADSPYRGRRSNDWLKVKCLRRGRFAVIGWLPSASRAGFRSLLLATHEGGALRYAGKVGTGFSASVMDTLAEQMTALETDTPPARVPPAAARGARWVRPGIEGEVGYAEVTADGVLRHARWLGTTAREAPMPGKQQPAVGAVGIRISNRGRVIFPGSGHTKGDLADYMQAMAPHILVHAANRPLSLVRCPEGVGGECFFQKHATAGFKGVRQTRVDSKGRRWIHVDDAAGLLACVQMGTIEFHGWGSRIGNLGRPDRLVIDLDPDEALPFTASIDAARHIRKLLSDMGLESVPMLSGGKGIHVIVPLDGSSRWPAVKDFARRFALALESAEPDRFIATARKAGRTGRIFVDWLRNQKGATAVMPWTVRSRPNASVTVPLDWAELDDVVASDSFTIADVDALGARAARLSGWARKGQPLPDL